MDCFKCILYDACMQIRYNMRPFIRAKISRGVATAKNNTRLRTTGITVPTSVRDALQSGR